MKEKAKNAVTRQLKAGNLPIAYERLHKQEPAIAANMEPAFLFTPDTRPTAVVLVAALNDYLKNAGLDAM